MSAETRQLADMVQLKLRFREHTRSRLEQAASGMGNSLNSEIVARLERSLDEDERRAGPSANALFHRLAMAIEQLESLSGERWDKDPATFIAVKRALLDEICAFDQPIADAPKIIAALDQCVKTKEALALLMETAPHVSDDLSASIETLRAKAEEADREVEAAYVAQRKAEQAGRKMHKAWRRDRLEKAKAGYGA